MKFFKNFNSYTREIRQSWSVYLWVYRELIPKESKKRLPKMIIPMALYAVSGVLIPFCFAGVVDGLVSLSNSSKQGTVSFWELADLIHPSLLWIAVVVAFLLIRLWLHHLYMINREYIKTANHGEIEDQINKKLFEKSRGQHLRFKNILSQSSLNRARSRIIYIESLVLFEGISAMFDLTISFLLIWVVSPFAGFVVALAFAFYIIRSLVMNKEVVETYKPIDDEYKTHNDKVEEVWDKAVRIKSFGTEEDVKKQLSLDYEDVSLRGRNFWIWFIKQIRIKDAVNVFALAVVYTFVTFEVARSVLSGSAEVGILIPIYSWTWSVVSNIWRIGHLEKEFSWSGPSIKKLKDALEIEADIVDSNPTIQKINETPHLRFEKVTFSHKDENGNLQPTLRGVTFDVAPGEKVALIGKSGAGKSTIGHLVLRGSDPDDGRITVNGEDLRDVSIRAWMDIVGEIPQDLEIFNDTLRANLLKAIPTSEHYKYSDQYISDMMDRFAINFNGSLPGGLDTELGHKGLKLSGGQKQRVAIGQMALKQPNILVVDEATSSLDATTIKTVQEGFTQLFVNKNCSGIFITHNLATVKDLCDRFIVLKPLSEVLDDDPQIEAIGSSLDELYDISPTLRQLMVDQGMVPVAN